MKHYTSVGQILGLVAVAVLTVAVLAESDFTADDRITLIQKHNEYRRGVDPTATNMRFMIWNQHLEKTAQVAADLCIFEHTTPNTDGMPEEWTHTGQNLYASTGSTLDPAAAVTSWNDEVADYTYETMACVEGKMCGHYTQVVWADSDMVGCGVRQCDPLDGAFGNDQKAFLVVCNYGVGGNVQGQKPYESGSSASNCPDSLPNVENKLCRREPFCGEDRCQNDGTLDPDTCECQCQTDAESKYSTCVSVGGEGGSGGKRSSMSFIAVVVGLLSVASWMAASRY